MDRPPCLVGHLGASLLVRRNTCRCEEDEGNKCRQHPWIFHSDSPDLDADPRMIICGIANRYQEDVEGNEIERIWTELAVPDDKSIMSDRTFDK